MRAGMSKQGDGAFFAADAAKASIFARSFTGFAKH